MTSINTNIAATTALRTLQQTNMQLDATQNRISTGLKIGEAKDNAAYWSISTTLRSDNNAMASVKDALGLGAATVDTAYQGLNEAKDVLDQIKAKLTAATQDGVDKTKIQAEIAELQKQLRSIATSSSFSGENWLSTDGSKTTASVVASFTRDASNNVSLGTISIALGDLALIDTATAANGILSEEKTGNAAGFETDATAATIDYTSGARTVASPDAFTFTVTKGTGPALQVVINAATMTNADVTQIDSDAKLQKVIEQALSDAKVSGVSVAVSGTTKVLTWSSTEDFTISAATKTGTANALTAANLGLGAAINGTAVPDASFDASVLDMNISTATGLQIQAYIDIISAASDEVVTAASNLGAVAKRIELQQSFVNNLMDTIDAGISGLVDADMNEESTRLQALQVKQQLGVQALSIANQSAQNVLRLFQ